ncbi:hypothetical protein B0T26DRAFT_649143 [Lasiosphaeria miniovina]|uniref:Uncharacterized protein n=1 Tax=Lasiosphaeria miniovina TaxID=1954250 RepID=A0AA40AB80_9PEZI|nr:uncharacterized protein B0T26DRAFT_649143 [Lasiosphaeria miniovina]KAK0712438.1 hypothetical protein B0T26DRAFT_649143 [Lasiosphaeria miniovina]
MTSLDHLVSQYPVLSTLASYVSSLDLFNLALTNRANHSAILSSPSLRRHCLCDGHGLRDRQGFAGAYAIPKHAYTKDYQFGGEARSDNWPEHNVGAINEDEPIEVRLYNIKCDEAGALPCRRCGINVCEECRYYPRIRPAHMDGPVRRPHLSLSCFSHNIMGFCPPCDARTESEVRGKFLSELCDCDMFRRWICNKCHLEEEQESKAYYAKHTDEYGWIIGPHYGPCDTKTVINRQNAIQLLYCPCGANVPPESRLRCSLCKRRHLPEWEWRREILEGGTGMPWFDDDPNYPHWLPYLGLPTKYPDPYPPLADKEVLRRAFQIARTVCSRGRM